MLYLGIDGPDVEPSEQLRDGDTVGLDRCDRHRIGRAVEQLKPARPCQRPCERRVLGGDQDPVAAPAVAPQPDVEGGRLDRWLGAGHRCAHNLRQGVPGIVGEAEP